MKKTFSALLAAATVAGALAAATPAAHAGGGGVAAGIAGGDVDDPDLLSHGRTLASAPVQRDHSGAAESHIVLEGERAPVHLPRPCFGP